MIALLQKLVVTLTALLAMLQAQHAVPKVGEGGPGLPIQQVAMKLDHSETHGVYDCSPACDTPDGMLAYGYAIADVKMGGYDVPTEILEDVYPYKLIWSDTLPKGTIEAHRTGTIYLDVYKDSKGNLVYSTTTQQAFEQNSTKGIAPTLMETI